MITRTLATLLLCWILAAVATAPRAAAQETESSAAAADESVIETDRDSFTRSPRVVELGRCVLEGSYTFLDQDAEFEGHLYPDFLARYGLTDWLELQVG